ncbi:unnamed protein product, partial [Ectocarpus fasciculatus]
MRAAPNLPDGSNRRRRRTSGSAATGKEGLFAYSLLEETRGFEIGSSAALISSEDDGGSGDSKSSKRPLHGANPNKNRDGAPVNVVALDVKYIKASKLLMVLRSDLTLAFFLGESNFLRHSAHVELVPSTACQQYVLEHCEATGMAFTSGFDGSILSFTIETRSTSSSSVDGDQQQPQYPAQQQQQQPQPHILASATQIGVLRRHTDVIQDLLAVSGTEAEGGQRLVSCGLDRRVCIWDIAKGTFVQSKHGNQAAIRSLAFDSRDNLLLGAGVEGEVLAWDMWARLGAPLFRMQGHRSPVVCVACAPGKGRAASLDERGKMILWDTRRNASVDNNERYLCQVDCSTNRPTFLDVVSDDTDDYLRWSHVGVSVVTSGRYMKIYDVVDPRTSEPPLAVALYSENCVSFVTCNGPFVTLWDACTGRAVRTDKATEGDIMHACLDGGERRLLLASSLGEILVYRFLQGTRIRTMSPDHDGPVSGMVYVKEDKVIVTGGWDRSLRVYDEAPREGDPPLLRQVEGAHCTDINAVAVSHRWSLIASGSADGSFRLWDLQFLSCEGSYAVGNEVLCVSFLEPYPLVAVGDAGGYVSVFLVRPWPGQGRVVGGAGDLRRSAAALRFSNDREAEETIEGGSAITCLTYRRVSVASCGGTVCDVDGGGGGGGDIGDDDTASGHALAERMVIYTGDDKGTVRAWEIGESLLAGLEGAVVPEHNLPRSQSNYDPRRRFNKQHVEPPSTDSESLGDDGHHLGTPTSHPEAESGLPSGNERDKATRVGILHDYDGETTRPQHQAPAEEVLVGGAAGSAHQPDTLLLGPELIGQWAPHFEAVVYLEVLEDPPCLLTASRDRSVKLRSLPAKYQRRVNKPAASDGPTARARRTAEKDREDSSSSSSSTQNNKGDSDSDRADPPSPTTPSIQSTQSSTITSTAPAKIPRHGRDLSTLTLGRIADGFRRDKYVFPVDHKGRGEGRAVEARAVLQAIEEIELRKEKRKQDEAALDRARGGAAAAAAAAAAKAEPTAATPTPPMLPTPTGEAAAAQTLGLPAPEPLPPPTVPRTAATPPDVSRNKSDAAAEPPYTDASGNISEHDRNLPVEPGDSCVGARASTAEQQQQQRVVPGSSTASPPPPQPPLAASRGEAAAAVDSVAAVPRVGGVSSSAGPAAVETAAATAAANQEQQRERSAAAVHKASSTFGIKKMASASRLTEQYKPPLAGGTRQRRPTMRGGGIAMARDDGNNNKKDHGMYENMAVEELRLKNLEASSKAAARCAREAVTIREMLQPSAFLLSQV